MKDYLQKLIARKNTELANLKKRSDESEDINEVKNIGEQMDTVKEEIKEAEASINALNAVICAFAKWFVSSASSYCELSFDLFTYGVEAPVFQSSSEIHKYSDSEFEVQEEDDDIIDTEPNEDDEFINDDDINNDDEQFGD